MVKTHVLIRQSSPKLGPLHFNVRLPEGFHFIEIRPIHDNVMHTKPTSSKRFPIKTSTFKGFPVV